MAKMKCGCYTKITIKQKDRVKGGTTFCLSLGWYEANEIESVLAAMFKDYPDIMDWERLHELVEESGPPLKGE